MMKGKVISTFLWTFLSVGLVLTGIFGYKAFGNYMMNQYFDTFVPPPSSVSVAKAMSFNWLPEESAIGSLRASQETQIASESPGLVTKIFFNSGDSVRSGQILLELKRDLEEKELQGLLAQLNLSRLNATRQNDLNSKNLNAKADVDAARAEVKILEAQVAAQEERIAQKTIRAPFSGVLGLRNLDTGTYLEPGRPIVNLQQLNPIEVEFNLPEKSLTKIQLNQAISIKFSTFAGETFSGRIIAIDNSLNPGSRTLTVRGEIPNPELRLKSGMFAQITIQGSQARTITAIPFLAITYNPYGNFVYVIQEDGDKKTVERRFIKTGEQRGDWVEVLEGINVGDTVVVVGQLRLGNGSSVVIDERLDPLSIEKLSR
jgi:membrane fusion protein (multidrug efflux system)